MTSTSNLITQCCAKGLRYKRSIWGHHARGSAARLTVADKLSLTIAQATQRRIFSRFLLIRWPSIFRHSSDQYSEAFRRSPGREIPTRSQVLPATPSYVSLSSTSPLLQVGDHNLGRPWRFRLYFLAPIQDFSYSGAWVTAPSGTRCPLCISDFSSRAPEY